MKEKEKTVVLNCWEKKIKDCPRVFSCVFVRGEKMGSGVGSNYKPRGIFRL
jgi:hypothetical protein